MSLIFYERVGQEGRRPSPFSWRIRYALAHKGLEAEVRPTRFADVDTIRTLSGQHMVPVLVDGDRVVHDSWAIAAYLEDRFPDRPSLFGGDGGRGMARFINVWSDSVIGRLVRPLIYADFIWCLDAGDRAYFRQSREKMLGMSLEAACADRPSAMAAFHQALAPLEQTLGEQAFVGGARPTYADHLVFSVFQWARLGSPQEVLTPGSAVHAWRARMIGLFNGLADRFPTYPIERAGTDGR